jgi:hypothetical protein
MKMPEYASVRYHHCKLETLKHEESIVRKANNRRCYGRGQRYGTKKNGGEGFGQRGGTS